MRLVLSMHGQDYGSTEAQRQEEIRAQRKKANRAKKLEHCKNHFFTSIRRGIALLIMVATITFAFSHQEEIQKLISTKLNQVLAHRNASAHPSLLRQGALNHEKEVDQIIQ